MELFKTFRKNFAVFGITSNARPLHSREIISAFLMNCLTAILCWMFLFCVANTFIEYTIGIYIASALTVVAICFTIVVFQIQNIFEFIEECEQITQKGKKIYKQIVCRTTSFIFFFLEPESKAMYSEIDHQIEKWSQIVYIVIAKITPVCFISPIFIYSLVIYFTTDLGNDAFELPLTVWYV